MRSNRHRISRLERRSGLPSGPGQVILYQEHAEGEPDGDQWYCQGGRHYGESGTVEELTAGEDPKVEIKYIVVCLSVDPIVEPEGVDDIPEDLPDESGEPDERGYP